MTPNMTDGVIWIVEARQSPDDVWASADPTLRSEAQAQAEATDYRDFQKDNKKFEFRVRKYVREES